MFSNNINVKDIDKDSISDDDISINENITNNNKLDSLSIDELVLNLKLISKIKHNDKMIVIDKVIQTDQRLLQPIRRWWTSDTREDTVNYVELIINQTIQYLNINNDNESILKELPLTIRGLDNLKSTYKADQLFKSKIDILKEKITRICNNKIIK
tara:strand:- start:495 stop:962 length:468 start_codon:yes stop_codon:yes gene_type:complete